MKVVDPIDLQVKVKVAVTVHAEKNLAGIDAAMEKINQAWQAASSEMYQGQEQGGPQPGAEQPSGEGESAEGSDVTDVDYEEVDGNK